MSQKVPPAEARTPVDQPGPVRRKPVWVQCEKFRCLARQDPDGKWRSFFGDQELTTFVSIIESPVA